MRAAITDVKYYIGNLFNDTETLRQASSFAAPLNWTGQPVKVPRFLLLSRLVDEHDSSNLVQQMDMGVIPSPSPPRQQVAAKNPAEFMRKVADGAGEPQRP